MLCVDYITTKEAAKNWGITDRMVVYHCSAGRINGDKKIGNTWLVLIDTEKPADGRYKSSKVKVVKINETDIFS
nr:DNA-binding protein [Clostridium sp. CMCC3677]